VVLTKPGEAALQLSKEAQAERPGAEAAVSGFLETASGEGLVSVNPRATAAAVTAQLRVIQPGLIDAGTWAYLPLALFLEPWLPGCSLDGARQSAL
jgi:hypothetical protein